MQQKEQLLMVMKWVKEEEDFCKILLKRMLQMLVTWKIIMPISKQKMGKMMNTSLWKWRKNGILKVPLWNMEAF